jgi:hypothetical protein
LVDLGLSLLDVEAPAGIALEQLRHLSEPCRRKLQLRLDRGDLGFKRRRIDLEQYVAGLERRIRLH